jgi:CheY-like chemotaxis protein/HPt (histidine-containing phosphotransfer) domain-containing protein
MQHDDEADRQGPLNGARILFADDIELNRLVLRDFLEGTGAILDDAADGAEAIAKAMAHRYDLIVLDLRMPGTDGYAAARAIRAREAADGSPPVPVVALTVENTEAERDLARQTGFTDFLSKPIAHAALIASLTAALAGAPPPPATLAGFHIPAGLEHLLPAFLAEIAKDLPILQRLAGGDNLPALAEYAHGVRGKCGMFGEERLFGLLGRLEAAAARANRHEIDEIMEEVIDRMHQIAAYNKAPE